MLPIAIVNTGNCNYKSVYYACEYSGLKPKLVDKYINKKFSGIIVPGVGNFGFAMKKLKKNNLDKFILEQVDKKIPSLFICLGMQILFESSDEDLSIQGLSLFKGKVVKAQNSLNNLICPIVGWNKIQILKKSRYFYDKIKEESYYFAHSYHAVPDDKSIIHSKTKVMNFEYCSSVQRENLLGVQFHPEKSYNTGLNIYKNFKKIIHEHY